MKSSEGRASVRPLEWVGWRSGYLIIEKWPASEARSRFCFSSPGMHVSREFNWRYSRNLLPCDNAVEGCFPAPPLAVLARRDMAAQLAELRLAIQYTARVKSDSS